MSDKNEVMLAAMNAQAELLNSINRRKWYARPFYEYMSGGLVWSDETDVSFDAINVLRPLFNYRSARILGKDDNRWTDYWRIANELFPKWIGFHTARCESTPKLRKLIRAGELKMHRECRQLDSDFEQNSV